MRETEHRWGRRPVRGDVGWEEALGDEAVSRRSSAKPQGLDSICQPRSGPGSGAVCRGAPTDFSI